MASVDKTRLVNHEAAVREEPGTIRSTRELNKRVPVSRLPPEILGDIFIYVAYDRSVRTPRCSWLWFSHVCFEWRQIALHTPRVWSHVYLTWNGGSIRELFARSKEAPLHIWTPRHGILPYQIVLRSISKVIHRIHTLQIWRVGELPESDEFSLPPAVELRRLELDAHRTRPSVLTSHGNCLWPKLSHLEIRSRAISMSWSHPILGASLTHFTFWGSTRDDETWDDVLAALSGLSSLKVLNLSSVLPRSSCSDALPVVELPRLEELRLSDYSPSCVAFLQHITFPNLVFISLGLIIPFNDDVSAASLEVATKLRDATLLDTRFRSVRLEYSNEFLDIMAWTKLLEVAELAEALDIGLQPHSYGSLIFRNRGFTLDISCLYDSRLLSGVRNLYLVSENPWDPHWEGLSAAMPHLRELGVAAGDGSAWGIARCFAPPAVNVSEPPARPLFPVLKVLMLADVRFCITTPLLERLQVMLGSRMAAGHAVDKLILKEPVNFGSDDLVFRLSCVVGKLEWDPPADDVIWDSEDEDCGSDWE